MLLEEQVTQTLSNKQQEAYSMMAKTIFKKSLQSRKQLKL